MERINVEVSQQAKDWIERFQYCKEDTNRERAAVQKIATSIIDNWISDNLTDSEAKDFLTTLRNADSIIESLGG